MEVFSLVFFKIISVLLSVIIGYIAGNSGLVNKPSISSLLFYFISPIVFFSIPANSHLNLNIVSVAIVSFTVATCLCFFSYYLYGFIWQDNNRNILALSAGTGNSVYFMLPIATYLFDEDTLSVYMMAVIGVSIFEASIGFYIGARSINSTRESIERVMKLPLLHAFLIGCFFSALGFNLPDFLDEFIKSMKITLSALGMMVIGLEVSAIRKFDIDFKFIIAALVSKFIFFPIGMAIFILLDKYLFGWYPVNYHKAFLLVSCTPMAINTIVISSLLNFNQEKVATAVLISSIFVLFYIPIMVTLFF